MDIRYHDHVGYSGALHLQVRYEKDVVSRKCWDTEKRRGTVALTILGLHGPLVLEIQRPVVDDSFSANGQVIASFKTRASVLKGLTSLRLLKAFKLKD